MRTTRTPAGVTEMDYRRAMGPNGQRVSSSTVDSAALQTEMAKKYNLAATVKIKQPKRVSSLTVSQRAANNHFMRTDSQTSTMICPCCQSSYTSTESVCTTCGYFANHLPQVPESLAQRRGLVPVAPKPATLTPFDWSVIENSRSDPDSCCPICMEGFKQGHEVLLSCSHIFHRTCLRSFENFMKDNALTCPICRTQNYQKKITHIGSQAFMKVSAAKIQRLWRGYAVRKSHKHRVREYYRSLGMADRPMDDALQARRKQYYENEFSSITDKLNENLHHRSNQLNSMLRSMDRTLIQSQQLDLLFEQMLFSRSQQQNPGATLAPLLLTGISASAGPTAAAPMSARTEPIGPELQYADTCGDFCVEAGQMWADVYKSAVSRCPGDCAICMLPVNSSSGGGGSSVNTGDKDTAGGGHSNNALRRDVVLSCAHIFHEKCIGNFEKFISGTRQRTCPVCRSAYSKRLFRIVTSAPSLPPPAPPTAV